MPGETVPAGTGVPAGMTSLPAGAPALLGVPASFNYAPGQVVPLPTPKLPKAPVSWRAPAVQLPQVANTHNAVNGNVSGRDAKQAAARASVQPSLLRQSAQAEPSGFMSTESDSDSPAQDKHQAKGKAKQQRKGTTDADPQEPSQAIRDYKGHSRQMITMAFLEEGGYFDVPIQVASQRLGLGVTTLKRVCRASGMKRWPFRKRNSLGRLIDRTKQVLDDGTGKDNMQKLAALQVLEKQRQAMRTSQGGESVDMDEKIKSYRQAIFKLDHAERKRGEELPNPGVNKSTATTAIQRILPDSDVVMDVAGPSQSEGR